jgi:hypothetical protein
MLFDPEDIFFSQKLKVKRKYSNEEFYLYQSFVRITKINPESVFIYNNTIIFFFVKNEEYFKAKRSLSPLRKYLRNKKLLIIRAEQTFIKLLFSFFPDTHIHDVQLDFNKKKNEKIITVGFLSFKDRGIAVGRNGDYINAVNKIFQKYVKFEVHDGIKIKIQCETMDLKNQY